MCGQTSMHIIDQYHGAVKLLFRRSSVSCADPKQAWALLLKLRGVRDYVLPYETRRRAIVPINFPSSFYGHAYGQYVCHFECHNRQQI